MFQLRCSLVATLLFLLLGVSLDAQEAANRPAILGLRPLQVLETESELEGLRKKSFNATHKEIRARINLWRQELASIDGVIDSIKRLQKLRLAMEPMPDELAFAKEELELASHLDRMASASPRAVLKETDKIILASYMLQLELRMHETKGESK